MGRRRGGEGEWELGAKAQIEKNFPRPAKHHRHQSEDIVCEEQWLPSQSRSLCVVACLRSQNPPTTAESLDYQSSRCKPQRTISSVALGGEASEARL